MYSVECTLPAIKKLKESGLEQRILEARQKWKTSITSISISDELKAIFTNARTCINNSEKMKMYSSIRELEEKINEKIPDWEEKVKTRDLYKHLTEYLKYHKQSLFMKYTSAIPYLILGDDIFSYARYGFETRKELEESITSYCLSNIPDDEDYYYVWHSNNYRNRIRRDYKNDLFVGQLDISGKDEKVETLFGERTLLETYKKAHISETAVRAKEQWYPWLAIILKYADAVEKKDLPESIWDIAKQPRPVKKRKKEEVLELGFLALQLPIGDQLVSAPIRLDNNSQSCPNKLIGARIYPCVKDNKLILSSRLIMPDLVFDETDLPHLLQGTYKLFPRGYTRIPKILELYKNGWKDSSG